jgi:hypothetical protein
VEDLNPKKVRLYESFGWYTNNVYNNRAWLNREFFRPGHMRMAPHFFRERIFCVNCGLMSTALPLSGDPVEYKTKHTISCEYIRVLSEVMES